MADIHRECRSSDEGRARPYITTGNPESCEQYRDYTAELRSTHVCYLWCGRHDAER